MEPAIRAGRPSDLDPIREFTTTTFSWGDYVSDRFTAWLDDPDNAVLVAADEDDQPIGLLRVAVVGPGEAWAQAARVHPAHRRRGIGQAMTEEAVRWAAGQGARVLRLVVDDWNEAAHGQVTRSGFRPVSPWLSAGRSIGAASPVPEGNGGRLVPPAERLHPASSAEAEPAFLSWSSGELARAARTLFPVKWVWRRLTLEDMMEAAAAAAFWEGRPGWAIGTPITDGFEVTWLETGPDDADALIRALVDVAVHTGAEHIRIKIPRLEWMERTLRQRNFEIETMTVYARGL